MDGIHTQFFIGTSGWTYDHWRGPFYPQDCPKSRWFDYYAARFSTVEINATFYRAFMDLTYRKWYERAPAGFCYVLKAPKTITHRKYLVDVGAEIEAFDRSVALLLDKLGIILLQIAPSTPYDLERLKTALLAFKDPRRVAVEFRHKRWITKETKDLLEDLGVTFCDADSPKSELIGWMTSHQAYLRLHGRKSWYSYDYTLGELQEIAGFALRAKDRGADRVFIFFNNDFEGYAPMNALALQEVLNVTSSRSWR
jgi:uncharacterized protein YecE (DUF72 family)